MEVDILTNTATSKKDLSNCQARKLNLESQLSGEIANAMKIKEIMARGIVDLMKEADRRG